MGRMQSWSCGKPLSIGIVFLPFSRLSSGSMSFNGKPDAPHSPIDPYGDPRLEEAVKGLGSTRFTFAAQRIDTNKA